MRILAKTRARILRKIMARIPCKILARIHASFQCKRFCFARQNYVRTGEYCSGCSSALYPLAWKVELVQERVRVGEKKTNESERKEGKK
jgi:hypothetical protein